MVGGGRISLCSERYPGQQVLATHWFVQEMLVRPWFVTLNSGWRRHQLSRKLRFAQKVALFCAFIPCIALPPTKRRTS